MGGLLSGQRSTTDNPLRLGSLGRPAPTMDDDAFLITTERQLLRPIRATDAAGLFALEADPIIRRFTGDDGFASLEAAERFAREYVSVHATDGMARWAVLDRETGDFLGWCGLRRQKDGSVDLGYRYRPDTWGRGLATEAARACVAYGFETLALEEIVAWAAPENVASVRILEKLGFQLVRFDEEDRIGRVGRWVLARRARRGGDATAAGDGGESLH